MCVKLKTHGGVFYVYGVCKLNMFCQICCMCCFLVPPSTATEVDGAKYLVKLSVPPASDSRRCEQSFDSLPGFYGHSQGSRGDVWGPGHRRINFLIVFLQHFIVFLHVHAARGGPQGEAGGPRGRVSVFSLCPLHLLPGRHQQRGGRAFLQSP